MKLTSARSSVVLAATALALWLSGTAVPSHAAYPHASVVAESPADVAVLTATAAHPEPHVDAIATDAGRVYVGGIFDGLTDQKGDHPRRNFAVLDETTGQVRGLNVKVDGQVRALVARGGYVYIGGDFQQVNGVARPHLAKIDAGSGRLVRSFSPAMNGQVNDLEIARGKLLAGGEFRRRLSALDTTSGARSGYVMPTIAGTVATGQPTAITRFAINSTRTRLVAVGNFTTAGGKQRTRAFMATLRPGAARVTAWYYAPLAKQCRTRADFKKAYLTDVDFAPDGSYFVVVATGYVPYRNNQIGLTICDAAARFETSIPAPSRPTWINYTGGDTLWSVAVTGAAVYVQGHNRWLDNPDGRDTKGAGAVDRLGIGAIDPTTGDALPWAPEKPARRGGRAFLATADGLWVGSDSATFARQPRRGLAFLPLP